MPVGVPEMTPLVFMERPDGKGGAFNAVHVSVDKNGDYSIDEVIKGDTVREVLAYVQYGADELTGRLRKDVERAVRGGKISLAESKQLLRFYESGLDGYTYLEEP